MQPLYWQQQLAQAIRHPLNLLDYVNLEPRAIGYSEAGLSQFPVRVPHAYADRIQRQNPDDPLLRQVFPYLEEEHEVDGYVHDPLHEANMQRLPGLIQKYAGRVLSITTSACAIHCRYCFRRHYPYEAASSSHDNWQASLELIRQDNSIDEVILSGGDPFSLPDKRLLEICQALVTIPHIERIRFHTRIPVVLPARILTSGIMQQLHELGKSLIIILHINHANEIDDTVSIAMDQLARNSQLLLNQSVLLKGVNDQVDTLIALSKKLVVNGVTPYYLHFLDPVAGAAHYAVDQASAVRLIDNMRERVSGYLVPKLVQELPDLASKQPL